MSRDIKMLLGVNAISPYLFGLKTLSSNEQAGYKWME
jgi:hypothetical protein